MGVPMFRILDIASKCILSGLFAVALLAHVNTAHATSFKVLHSFSTGLDGCYPAGGLIIDGAGNLYGTTAGGYPCNCGTVFEIPAGGTETPLYDFTCGSNGSGPDATLVMDKKGNLYGSTIGGGSIGCGVIFKVTPNGTETTAHDFADGPNDGCTSQGTLIINAKGILYGTTSGGGKYGNGTVFKLSPGGAVTLLHSFNKARDGVYPYAGLLMNAAGDLYGTAGIGGSRKCAFECGTVFALAPERTMTLLYKFKGPPNDGSLPEGDLLMDHAGNLDGTLSYGGSPGCEGNLGCGAAFELAPDGTETILHFFTGKNGDGGNPFAGLTADNAGNLYGTTAFGGSPGCTVTQLGCGNVFEIGSDGAETVLHSFGKGNNGANPVGRLVADDAGHFYGTTALGGADGYGTVFELTP
jgi:uncharacterized repeat protein (TIGR03803 family)